MSLTRRQFALSLGAAALPAQTTAPRVAITMDDFHWRQIPGSPDPNKTNRAILGALARHSNLRAALFVVADNADNETGGRLLRAWCDAGHLVANHTYSHPSLHSISAAEFTANIAHADTVLRNFSTFQKIFRFPALKEGDTREKRDAVRQWLAAHSYRTGHVTIDTSDWYYDRRLRARVAADPNYDTNRYRQPYLDHIWECANYYETLAPDVLGHTVPHTILVHYTYLNVLFLDDLLTMFESKGWQLISPEVAFRDPVFAAKPDIVPAGESIIWQLAKADGRFSARLRYPGEDSVYEKEKLDRLGL